MPKPPSKRLINTDELFGSRDIGMHDRRESQYPQLMRLCADFNFSVLQLQRKIFSHLTRKMVPSPFEFVLATYDDTTRYWYSVTPNMNNLKTLNDYVKQYEVDILHMQLFGEDDENHNQFTENSFY
jgi:hypothetical protein